MILLTLFFIILLYIVHILPILICKKRALKFNIVLTKEEAREILKCKCSNNDFFKVINEVQNSNLKISIKKIANHSVSGGNILNVVKWIKYAKENNIDIPIDTIFVLDLLHKDIGEAIRKGKPYYY